VNRRQSLAWLHDHKIPKLHQLSQLLELITGLKVAKDPKDYQFRVDTDRLHEAEAYQVKTTTYD